MCTLNANDVDIPYNDIKIKNTNLHWLPIVVGWDETYLQSTKRKGPGATILVNFAIKHKI